MALLYQPVQLIEYRLPDGKDFSNLLPRVRTDEAFYEQLAQDEILREVYYCMKNKLSRLERLGDVDSAIRTVLDAVINRAHFAMDQKEFLRLYFNRFDLAERKKLRILVLNELRITLDIMRPLLSYIEIKDLHDDVFKSFREDLDETSCGPPIVPCDCQNTFENHGTVTSGTAEQARGTRIAVSSASPALVEKDY